MPLNYEGIWYIKDVERVHLAVDETCASLQAAEVQVRAVEDIEARIAELQERHDAMIGENIQYIEKTLSGASDFSLSVAWMFKHCDLSFVSCRSFKLRDASCSLVPPRCHNRDEHTPLNYTVGSR